jgi:beta-phosphoglucomutase
MTSSDRSALRAVLFDCDGVIADDEPLHLRGFQEALAPLGITVSPSEYTERYLGFDDRGAFTEMLRDHGRAPDRAEIDGLIARKAAWFRVALADAPIYPGVVELVRQLAGMPLAVASGALRHEVEIILARAGIREHFAVVVTAEDVAAGKPDPAPFLEALAALNAGAVASPIAPADCLVIEDSLAGIEAAKRAGMRCLAVTNSYPAAELQAADRVVATLAGLVVDDLHALFPGRAGD